MRSILPVLALCASIAAPVAAQSVTVERDGSEITIIRPDGTTERFTVDDDEPLRVRVKDGPLRVEREGLVDGDTPELRRRYFEARKDGERARAFAFRTHPGESTFQVEDFMRDFDVESGADSAREGLLRFHRGPGDVEMFFDGTSFGSVPGLPGFGMRGVDPETRRAIAEGERESRALARRLRRAEGNEREALTEELRQTLERTFDLKQQAHRERTVHLQAEAERLRTKLAELESEVAERDEARRDIIERRQRELLGERDELDW